MALEGKDAERGEVCFDFAEIINTTSGVSGCVTKTEQETELGASAEEGTIANFVLAFNGWLERDLVPAFLSAEMNRGR